MGPRFESCRCASFALSISSLHGAAYRRTCPAPCHRALPSHQAARLRAVVMGSGLAQDQQIFAWHDKFGTFPEFPNGTKRAAAEAAAMLIKQAAVDAAEPAAKQAVKPAAKQAAKKAAAEQAEATQKTKDQAAKVAADKWVVAQQAAPAKAEAAVQV